jgi:hypothetical protein
LAIDTVVTLGQREIRGKVHLSPKKRPSGRGHIQAVGERRKRVEESRRQGFHHYVNLTILTRFYNDSKFLAIATRGLHISIILKQLIFFLLLSTTF